MNLKYDIRELQQLRERLEDDQGAVEKALRWSVDATSKKAATFISRDLRSTYAIKAGDVKRRLKIERARRDATRALLYTGRRLPLAQFAPKEKWVAASPKRRVRSGPRKGRLLRRKGATVRVRKDRGRQLVPGGWLAKGHILRRADQSQSSSQPRMQYGPSIPGMVAHPETINQAQEFVRQDLPEQFSDRLDYLLSKKVGQI